MNRRDAVAGLLALAAMTGPLRTNAQATKQSKPFRIVTLPDLPSASRGWFSDAMSDLGWAEGRDFIVVQSGFQGYQFSERQLDEAARRFVADKPDLIVTTTTAWALAAHRATATIPIVMYSSGYPVESGLADNLARPGKNVTGNAIYAGTEVWGKLLQLLYEAKLGIKRISVLWAYVPPHSGGRRSNRATRSSGMLRACLT